MAKKECSLPGKTDRLGKSILTDTKKHNHNISAVANEVKLQKQSFFSVPELVKVIGDHASTRWMQQCKICGQYFFLDEDPELEESQICTGCKGVFNDIV